jgi:hypothetical protein
MNTRTRMKIDRKRERERDERTREIERKKKKEVRSEQHTYTRVWLVTMMMMMIVVVVLMVVCEHEAHSGVCFTFFFLFHPFYVARSVSTLIHTPSSTSNSAFVFLASFFLYFPSSYSYRCVRVRACVFEQAVGHGAEVRLFFLLLLLSYLRAADVLCYDLTVEQAVEENRLLPVFFSPFFPFFLLSLPLS